MDDDEIDLGAEVGDDATVEIPSDADAVGFGRFRVAGGFDLDFAEAAAGVDDEVVASAVAVGLGDFEAARGRLMEKGEFGQFAATLGFARGPG